MDPAPTQYIDRDGAALAKPEEELNFRRLSFVYGVDDLPVRF